MAELKFTDGFLNVPPEARTVFGDRLDEEGKIAITEFRKLIEPLPGRPVLILADAIRTNVNFPDRPVGFVSAYNPERRKPDAVAIAANQYTVGLGLNYTSLFVFADRTGLVKEQIKQEEFDILDGCNYYNPSGTRQIEEIEKPNIWRNLLFIEAEMLTGISRNIFQGCKKGQSVIVVGSGAPFDDALPLLKQWQGDIICSTSHTSTLWHEKIPNVHSIALDVKCDVNELHESGEFTDEFYEYNSLLTHPGISPLILQHWKKNKFYFRCMDTQHKIYQDEKEIYNFITTECLMFAHSLPTQISLAQFMGYEKIFLVGCDFSIHRFHKWYLKENEWLRDDPGLPIEENRIKGENGVYSTRILVYYKRTLLMSILMDCAPVITTDKVSLITELPRANLETVIRSHGNAGTPLPAWKLMLIIEPYLARYNTFMIRYKHEHAPGRYKYVFYENPGNVTGMIQSLPHIVGLDKDDIAKNTAHLTWLGGMSDKSPYIEEAKG